MAENLVLVSNAAHLTQMAQMLSKGQQSAAEGYLNEQVPVEQLTQLVFLVTELKQQHEPCGHGFYNGDFMYALDTLLAMLLGNLQTLVAPLAGGGPF